MTIIKFNHTQVTQRLQNRKKQQCACSRCSCSFNAWRNK